MQQSAMPLLCALVIAFLFPPVAQSAEPNFKIRMLTGSEIAADKAWVQGDRLLYERSGFSGSVRMVDVAGLIDRELEETVAHCTATAQNSLKQMQATKSAAEELRKKYPNQEARSAISEAEKELLSTEVSRIQHGCAGALTKQQQNRRMFDEARQKSSR